MSLQDLRLYVCEYIGTFTLVVFAAGAVMIDALTGGKLGPMGCGLISGTILTVIIFMFGNLSGAHVNPALSIAAVTLGLLPLRRLPGYVMAQLAGSVSGGLALLMVFGKVGQMGANVPDMTLGIGIYTVFIIEIFLSFILMMVIVFSISGSQRVSEFAAIPIGAVVGIQVMLMGPIAGAAMNPARAIGPYVALGDYAFLWIYVLGPLAGMMLGAWVFRLLRARGEVAAPVAAPVTSEVES